MRKDETSAPSSKINVVLRRLSTVQEISSSNSTIKSFKYKSTINRLFTNKNLTIIQDEFKFKNLKGIRSIYKSNGDVPK
jgi:hypothetical protein